MNANIRFNKGALVVALLLSSLWVANCAETGEPRRESSVHVVGIYEAGPKQHFNVVAPWGRDTDWSLFSASLLQAAKKQTPSPAKRLWDLLPEKARRIVADENQIREMVLHIEKPEIPPSVETAGAFIEMAAGLSSVLGRRDFHTEESFQDIRLDREANELLKRKQELSLLENCFLNRRLFERSFPNSVKPTEFSLEKATVPVRVREIKQPITLVLCSHDSVRWQIKVDKGAKIDKVIVGGYQLQTVTGTEAPVSYHVYDLHRFGRPTTEYFYAYKQDQENYPKLVEAVRKKTGKEIASFQGRYSYQGGAPFVVGPKE